MTGELVVSGHASVVDVQADAMSPTVICLCIQCVRDKIGKTATEVLNLW
jgi:hypothetical protein